MAARLRPALVGVCLVALALAAPAQAAFPGENGKIAYYADSGVSSINPDGSGQASLPGGYATAWSPDGSSLAISDNNLELSVINADGSGLRKVYDQGGGVVEAVAWSPDGGEIVFWERYVENGGGDTAAIIICDATAYDVCRFLVDPRDALGRGLSWSPRGDRIAFSGYSDAGGGIHTIRPDGTGLQLIAAGANLFVPDYSPDGSRLTFERYDGSQYDLLVMNADGTGETSLTGGPADDTAAAWSPDGTRIAFYSNRSTAGVYTMRPDGTDQSFLTSSPATAYFPPPVLDWQPVLRGYIRPKAAAPMRVSLVPAYDQCTSAALNRTHGPPLGFASCNPPAQTSGELTVGTADANGAPAKSIGFVRYGVQVGNPATPADEANVRIIASVSDVRNSSDLSDYTGELQLDQGLRITDRDNTPYPGGPGPGTVTDTGFPVTIPCAATADTSVGSTCSIDTTAEAIVPNAVKEGRRAVWALGQVKVYDGGSDGDTATTADNTLFLEEGLFVP